MYSIIYSSIAVKAFSPNELEELLLVSRFSNRDKEITGALLYDGGRKFIQAIEGPETNIKLLFQKIIEDHRHHSVQILSEGRIHQRNFELWSMHYKEYEPEDTAVNSGTKGLFDIFGDMPVLDFDPTVQLAEAFKKQFEP